ncbi:phospholipid phosphatase 1-like isoform X2 [Littorina saxatilis]|uniref:Phosphatidic acid phosphatase type 2/haloperoxidase domain-containing protein n=1 Tax=Littorina saxatilis TaxID=31220 RepID=A0AAN9G8A6_9CAEN
MAESATVRCALGVVGDISVIIIIGVSSVLIRQLATPFHRGFFRDDESLMHPYHEGSTVPVAVLYGVGFALPTLAIILIEGGWIRLAHNNNNNNSSSSAKAKRDLVKEWLWNVYRACLMFYFGVVVTHISTNVPKYAIGRLRPHFFTICAPDLSKVSPDKAYIEADICTGNDTAAIQEARVSFPSGHSSMAIFVSLFLALYLQRRFTWQGMILLKPFLQTVFLLLAFYTCLSRISDYKHHWSDVLAGGLLGVIVAVLVLWGMSETCLQPQPDRSDSASKGLLVQGTPSASYHSTQTSQPPPQSTAL